MALPRTGLGSHARGLLPVAPRTPIPAAILEIPDQFLLFRVHRDRRLAAFQEPRHLGVEVLELGVAVGMRGAFSRLAVALQAIARLVEQGRHRAVAHRMRLPGQFLGQRATALDRPSQRRFRIAPRCRFHQASSAGNNCGSFTIMRRRPPPGLRMRSGGSAAFPRRGVFNSAIPARTVRLRHCVASATAVTPPQPISRASLAAHNRRDRSLSAPRSRRNFRRILAMTCASCIPKSSQNPPIGTISNSPSYFFTDP